MKAKVTFAAVALFAITTAGCTTFSGLSGSSSTACKAPEGINCQSMSGVYANHGHEMVGQPRAEKQSGSSGQARARLAGLTQLSAGAPVMSPTQVLRIWFAPWRDADNDMQDESVLYTVRSPGHWIIDAAGSDATIRDSKHVSIDSVVGDDGMRKVSTSGDR